MSPRRTPIRASPTISCSMQKRLPGPRSPAATASPSTGARSQTAKAPFALVRWAHARHRRRGHRADRRRSGRCLVGRRAGTRREGSRTGQDASSRRRKRPHRKPGPKPHECPHRTGSAEHLSRRSRRARPFRHLRRPLRRRDADAADPRSGAGLCRGQGRSKIPGRDGRPSRDLCRQAIAALFRRAAHPALRRREDLFQARGAQSHRRAQGEQCARPDHAGAAHGQDAHHRRDRRRHAWRRHRNIVREVRPALHRLHGIGGCRAAEAERAADEDPRRRGSRRGIRLQDAEGCDERGIARLGRQCARHLLLHRHGGRPASLSGHGARFPIDHRP